MDRAIAEHGGAGVFGNWEDWGDAIALNEERSSKKFPSLPEVEQNTSPPNETPVPHNVAATLGEVVNFTHPR